MPADLQAQRADTPACSKRQQSEGSSSVSTRWQAPTGWISPEFLTFEKASHLRHESASLKRCDRSRLRRDAATSLMHPTAQAAEGQRFAASLIAWNQLRAAATDGVTEQPYSTR